MSCCARCGREICSTAGKIALNKVWHKNCFCCYNCNRPLHVNNAKVFYGEVFCNCCYPQQPPDCCPFKICRVNSTPSFNPDCCPKIIKTCCSSDMDCRARDIHSCSCIPACCKRRRSPVNCECRPKLRTGSPRGCNCGKCCQPPRRKFPVCPPPPPPYCVRRNKPDKNKIVYFQPCERCCCNSRQTERCRRCGEKVFAAEKILTSNGAYHMGCFSCNCCCKSLCVKTMYEACGEIYCKQCYNHYFGVSGYGYSCCR